MLPKHKNVRQTYINMLAEWKILFGPQKLSPKPVQKLVVYQKCRTYQTAYPKMS